jgi:hypothetical protein
MTHQLTTHHHNKAYDSPTNELTAHHITRNLQLPPISRDDAQMLAVASTDASHAPSQPPAHALPSADTSYAFPQRTARALPGSSADIRYALPRPTAHAMTSSSADISMHFHDQQHMLYKQQR